MHTKTTLLVVAALVGCARSTPPQAAPAEAPAAQAPAAEAVSPLRAAIDAPHRSPEARARDAYRHPEATLTFCGVTPDKAVIELSPGGGWYTAILAPLLRASGTYIAAVPSADGRRAKYRQRFLDFAAATPELYDRAEVVTFDPPAPIDLGPAGRADVVLTFRNTHSWIGDEGESAAYAAAFEALKPGGTFCVVQHRAPESDEASPKDRAKTGYVKQSYVIEVAQAAGFVLDETSEINANPADTTDHPEGVWTLPPGFALGDVDRDRYAAIGESDRMTLRFVKPAE